MNGSFASAAFWWQFFQALGWLVLVFCAAVYGIVQLPPGRHRADRVLGAVVLGAGIGMAWHDAHLWYATFMTLRHVPDSPL